MKKLKTALFFFSLHIVLGTILQWNLLYGQSAMINVSARKTVSLNGRWNTIIDPIEKGEWLKVWEEKTPEKKSEFIEYSFQGGPILNVPSDFNTQLPELTYYEGTVWYQKKIHYNLKNNRRLFLYFGAVNYMSSVYLNGELLGSHEGGFTPFQFEITNHFKKTENTIVIKVNNQRRKDGLPSDGYDWFNYGGITRDVNLVETSESFIEDYSVQLGKNSFDKILGWIKMNGTKVSQKIKVKIPELKLNFNTKTDNKGFASLEFKAKFKLWSPSDPKLYQVIIQSETDTIKDEIGFRNIETQGTKIVLNGTPVFLKAVNIHEEIPMRGAKAYSLEDDIILLNRAKELGCNMVRLAHYPPQRRDG